MPLTVLKTTKNITKDPNDKITLRALNNNKIY